MKIVNTDEQTTDFNVSFTLLLDSNPVMKDSQGICIFQKQMLKGKGYLRFIKIEHVMVVTTRIKEVKDIIAFDISDCIGFDTFFVFNVIENRIAKIFLQPQGQSILKSQFRRL